jgi:serine/threonine protein kinase
MGPAKAAFFLGEIAQALAYQHECGIVHRDLKPHNVFYEQGVVKIGDYSLSKVITASHRGGHTVTVGTVHYMAPEISLGRYDHSVDIYALGVLLYEMLTGQPPFTGDSVGEVLMKHVGGNVDVTGIPEPFATAVQTAMSKEPSDRYQEHDGSAGGHLRARSCHADLAARRDPEQVSLHGDPQLRLYVELLSFARVDRRAELPRLLSVHSEAGSWSSGCISSSGAS